MTKGLLASRRTKLKLLLISKENPSVENLNAYKQFRNLYNQLIRASKRMYYSEKIDSSKVYPKSLWKTIYRKQSKNSSIDSILVNNLKTSNPTEMANGFNDFFSNIAGNINNLIPKTSVLPESFLKNYPDINYKSPEEIIEIIKSLENTKNCGH